MLPNSDYVQFREMKIFDKATIFINQQNIIEKANKIEMFNEMSNSGGAPMVKGEIRFENKSEYR